MITLEEVMLHIKKENTVGSDKYEKLLKYLQSFSEDELSYLEIKCKVKVENYNKPVSWNYLAAMIVLFSVIVSIVSMFTKESEIQILVFGMGLLICDLIIACCVFGLLLREEKMYKGSVKYMEILELIHKAQEKNKLFI